MVANWTKVHLQSDHQRDLTNVVATKKKTIFSKLNIVYNYQCFRMTNTMRYFLLFLLFSFSFSFFKLQGVHAEIGSQAGCKQAQPSKGDR